MKVLLQRVSRAAVRVDGVEVAAIGPGLLVFVGVERGDDPALADWYAGRIATIRMFPGGDRPMERSVGEVGGAVLVVSQFTLAARTRKGRRPSFDPAADPSDAEALYLEVAARLRERGLRVATGRFREHMDVELVNDGPVTFLLDGPDRPRHR